MFTTLMKSLQQHSIIYLIFLQPVFFVLFFLITLFILKRAKSPDFASQSSSSNLQFNISASYMLSCLSVLKILSDTQQIFQEVNVQRGITLLTDGTCHHDRTGNNR